VCVCVCVRLGRLGLCLCVCVCEWLDPMRFCACVTRMYASASRTTPSSLPLPRYITHTQQTKQWEQRNTQFQTLMLAATVMFGGGLGVIVEVRLSPPSPSIQSVWAHSCYAA
jgi:hypothetical protein